MVEEFDLSKKKIKILVSKWPTKWRYYLREEEVKEFLKQEERLIMKMLAGTIDENIF